ncbi:MAG: tetratricopeptide repeat protein [Methanobacteriota archaeon]
MMRLTSITLLVLVFVLILILLFPALFLDATASVLPDQLQQNAGNLLAEFSISIGRPLTAVDVYDFLIIKHSESADIFQLKGDALLQSGDITGALNAYDAALVRASQNPILMIKKVRILIGQGKEKDAEPIYQQILAIQTDNPEYLSLIADIALEKARYLEAFNRYSQIISQGKGTGLTYEKRSDVIFALLTIPTASADAPALLKSKDLYSEGMQGYDRAIQLSPDRSTVIREKIDKRIQEVVPQTINELEGRYQQYRYLQLGEQPLPS